MKVSNRDWPLIFIDIWANFYVIAKKYESSIQTRKRSKRIDD